MFGDRKAIFSIWHLEIGSGVLANQCAEYCDVAVVSDRQLHVMIELCLKTLKCEVDILKYD